MTSSHNHRSSEHLMHVINTRNGKVPNFSLLLGSGASKSSGVTTAQEMISEWRSVLGAYISSSQKYHGNIDQDALDRASGHDDEYSILFEAMYDQPSQRRVHIEECIKEARPSWGYVYLTSFLQDRLFDVIFTTNFDDLINEACYLYSEKLRPIVAAHDSVIQEIRVTAGRPKIIKLHGDFLYDNIKNTIAELETLEVNTKRKLSQFAKEYGLVVIGYSGRDRSVMDTLELLLKDEENYKHGVYWCQLPNEQPCERLQSLLRRDRVYLVEIDGFDEFMADLHKSSELSLPISIARPLEMAAERILWIADVENPLRTHPVIRGHIRQALNSINTARTRRPRFAPRLEAAIHFENGDIDGAIEVWKRAYQENVRDAEMADEYANALADAGKRDELVALVDEFISNEISSFVHLTFLLLRAQANERVLDLAEDYLDNSNESDFSKAQESYVRINRAIALKRLGRSEEMEQELRTIENINNGSDPGLTAGVASLRGKKREMFEALDQVVNKTISAKNLVQFPVFEDYHDDAEFKRLVEVAQEQASVQSAGRISRRTTPGGLE